MRKKLSIMTDWHRVCVAAVLFVFGLTIMFYQARNDKIIRSQIQPIGVGLIVQQANGNLLNEELSSEAIDAKAQENKKKNIKNAMLQTINRNLFNYMSQYLKETPYPGVLNYTNYMITFLNATPLENVKPLLPDFQPVLNDVRSFEYDIELERCVPANGTTLFVLINSAAENLNRRNAIRQSWYKTLMDDVINKVRGSDGQPVVLAGIGFAIGRKGDGSRYEKIKSESEQFGDILEINMADTYYNLSVKVAAYLNWIDTRCPNVDFVLKVDDDVYVNVRNLVSFIHQLVPERAILYGRVIGAAVMRDDSNKRKMTHEQYPWRGYPNYFTGAGALIAGKAIRRLLAAIQTIPYHQFEDLYLTGFCSERAGVALLNADRFVSGWFEDSTAEACYVRNSIAWITTNVDKIKNSHTVTEEYYNNTTQCIPQGSNMPVNPGTYVNFSLKQISHLRT